MIQDTETPSFETYKSPTEKVKSRIVDLLFQNVEHKAKSRKDPDEKFAFCIKTKALSILLERYTPKDKLEELQKFYDQLEKEVEAIKESKDATLTDTKKEDEILKLNFSYAEEVNDHNERILMDSPIIETEVEGELDISDEDMIDIVRFKEARKDNGTLQFKH